jgi:hypothetical protein
LRSKALSSLKTALSAFNGFDEDGRTTKVLLHLQHSSEMLLKGALAQTKISVFDKRSRTSLGFKKCINLATEHCNITTDEAGIFRAIDAIRDAEQHWIVTVSEEILYIHTRAFVTAFDSVLKRSLDGDLATFLPTRVLPVGSRLPSDFDTLIDREYGLVAELLAPGRRAQDEARARIRTMLAMESHIADDVEISERDVDRVVKAIKGGKAVVDVFPRLMALQAQTSGTGPTFGIRIDKKAGLPVRLIAGDDPEESGAVREIDLRKRFYMSPSELQRRLDLTGPKATAARRFAGVDNDPTCCHVFQHGSQTFPSFSDKAYSRVKAAIDQHGIDAIWTSRGLQRGRQG